MSQTQWEVTRRLPADFRALMSSYVTIEHHIGRDQYGKDLYGPSFTVRCRIDNTLREYRTSATTTQGSTTVIVLDGVYHVDTNDRITLPNGKQPPIVNVDVFSDDKGPLYEEVLT